MERLGRWGFMEIEVTTENLVGTLARQHHLYAHRLDDTRQQIHWRRGTHGRHVIGLYEIDHIANGIETLLDGVVYFVMHGTYIIGHELSLSKVWRSFQAHRKRVEARPPCTFLVVVFYATLRKFLCNGTDD